jgi:hypothetical protein
MPSKTVDGVAWRVAPAVPVSWKRKLHVGQVITEFASLLGILSRQ